MYVKEALLLWWKNVSKAPAWQRWLGASAFTLAASYAGWSALHGTYGPMFACLFGFWGPILTNRYFEALISTPNSTRPRDATFKDALHRHLDR